jgi:GTP pyrophosphokinase
VTVHTTDCQLALESDPERRIEIAWNKDEHVALPVKIRVTCHDRKGTLANISQAITNCEANIISASIQSTVDKRGENLFEIEVTDLNHLTRVINNIMKLNDIIKVERVKS